jgi:hypothetical protein
MFDPCFHPDQFLEQQGFFVESFAAVVSQHDDFSVVVHFRTDVPPEGLLNNFTATIDKARNNTIMEMYLIHFGLGFGGQHSPFSQPQSLFTVFVGSIEFLLLRDFPWQWKRYSIDPEQTGLKYILHYKFHSISIRRF